MRHRSRVALVLNAGADLLLLTSSTRPKPPTPRVAMTSRWSKGLDGENTDTISLYWMTSAGSGWLWWRDTDFLRGASGR